MASFGTDVLKRVMSIVDTGSLENAAVCRDEYLRTLVEPLERLSGESFQHTEVEEQEEEEDEKETKQTEEFIPDELTQAELEAILGRSIEGADFVFFKNQNRRKSSFDEIKLKIIASKEREISNNKYYRLIAKSALYMAVFMLLKRVVVVFSIFPGNISVLPYKLFSWSLDSLTFRAELPNLIHIGVVDIEIDKNELDNLKFKMDIHEILNYTKLIYENINEPNYVSRKLDELNQAVNFESTFAIPHMKLSTEHRKLSTELFLLKQGKVNPQTNKIQKLELDNLLNEVSAFEPIKTRYAVNWYSNDVTNTKYKNDMELKKISDQIEYYKQLIVQNEFTFRCSQNMYYVIIEDYKMQLNQLAQSYDIDFDNAENTVNITRNDLIKAIDNLNFFQEQVEMFKRRTREVLEQIAKEEAERIWRLENPPPPIENKKKDKKQKRKRIGKK